MITPQAQAQTFLMQLGMPFPDIQSLIVAGNGVATYVAEPLGLFAEGGADGSTVVVMLHLEDPDGELGLSVLCANEHSCEPDVEITISLSSDVGEASVLGAPVPVETAFMEASRFIKELPGGSWTIGLGPRLVTRERL